MSETKVDIEALRYEVNTYVQITKQLKYILISVELTELSQSKYFTAQMIEKLHSTPCQNN